MILTAHTGPQPQPVLSGGPDRADVEAALAPPGARRSRAGVQAANATWSLRQYFVAYARDPLTRQLVATDLRDAVVFLRDRWRDYGHIFVSDHQHAGGGILWPDIQPYIYVLAYLPVEPREFHAWDKQVSYPAKCAPFHTVDSMGPFTMSTRAEVLARYFETEAAGPALIVARPGDISGGQLLHTVTEPPGQVRFQIIEVRPP